MANYEDIKSYYVNILQREPSDDEVRAWEASVSSEHTIDDIRQEFIDSAEGVFVGAMVRLYQAAFDRVPDQGGLKVWVNSGLSLDEIADGFCNSQEFNNRYGSNEVNEAFVISLYKNVLGREPDADGLANWTNSGLSAAQMLAGFSEAQEFKNSINSAVSTFLDECGKGTQDYEGKLDDYLPQPEFTITGGMETLAAANNAKVEFLITADGDDDEETSATESDVETGLANAIDLVDDLVGGDYTNGSARIKAALLEDQIDLNKEELTTAQKTLTEAKAAVVKVSGLTQAISKLEAATKAVETAEAGVDDAEADLAAAEASYQVKSKTNIDIEEDGTIENLIVLKDGKLTLATGVTETTNKGITAVLNASIVKEAADKALTDANAKEDAAQLAVNDLDLTPEAVSALEDIAAAMELEEGKLPTRAQFESKIDSLEAKAVTALETAEKTEATDLRATALNAGILASDAEADDAAAISARAAVTQAESDKTSLESDIDSVTYLVDTTNTENIFRTFTAAAVTAKLLTDTDRIAINTAFENALTAEDQLAVAKDAAKAALANNNQIDELTDVAEAAEVTAAATNATELRAKATADDTAATNAEKADQDAVDAQLAVTEFQDLVDTYNNEAQVNPLIAALTPAEAGVEAAQEKIDALTDAVADLTDAQKLVTDLGDLNKAITAAEDAFTENGLELPITLVDSSYNATDGSDIFLAGSGDSAINDFGLLGDDMLYVGSKFTLNTGDLADDGVDSVLEMFLVESGNDTVVTLEAKPFGSNSSDEEQTITLVGVAVEDVKFENGFISTTSAIV